MGFEIKCTYHPRSESGYDTNAKEEKTFRVGKPFDDTSLEKCAAAILAQLARRDVWVVGVEVNELVKKPINFKESADGKGIVLKNKRFSFNGSASFVSEVEDDDEVEVEESVMLEPKVPEKKPQGVLEEEQIAPNPGLDNLYKDPNKSLVSKPSVSGVNQKKVLYHVLYEPYFHAQAAKSMNLKFSEGKRYPVHAVVPSPSGKLDANKIALTDDTGKVVILDEKFFTVAGSGLTGTDFIDEEPPRLRLGGFDNLQDAEMPNLR